MKYYIFSDIHGSFYYIKKAIDEFSNGKGDKIILLGDILYHGPRNPLPKDYNPQAVFELLNQYKDKIIWIKGNCDSEVDEMVLTFKAYHKKIIKFKKYRLILTHGHLFTENNYPLGCNDILLYGHFHTPSIITKNGWIAANPGSISLPKPNYPNTFMILDDKEIKILDFKQNIIQAIKI